MGENRMAARRDAVRRVLLALILAVSTVLVGDALLAKPAFAADTANCIEGSTKGVGAPSYGETQRWTGGTTKSNITVKFTFRASNPICTFNQPGNADIRFGMNVSFCSGGGGSSDERLWLGSNQTGGPKWENTPATDVLAGTCFKLNWVARNSATANKAWKAHVIWQTS